MDAHPQPGCLRSWMTGLAEWVAEVDAHLQPARQRLLTIGPAEWVVVADARLQLRSGRSRRAYRRSG